MPGTVSFQTLIADENFLNRRVLQERLGSRGCSVHALSDGAEVIHAREPGCFDAAVVRWVFDSLTGLLATVRATE